MTSPETEPLDPATLDSLRALYKQLIDAEDRHDLATVRAMVWKSPSALFVAKTATPAEGNWAGFWGTDVVVTHIGDLFSAGSFHIDPDYAKEKVVGLTRDVAETYAPVAISVAYAGQTPVPKPFIMILDWIRTPGGWRMATDIALPIPPPPAHDPLSWTLAVSRPGGSVPIRVYLSVDLEILPVGTKFPVCFASWECTGRR